MSIFSGWNRENLGILWRVITTSPEGAVVAGVGLVVCVLVIGFAVSLASREIGGFYARVQEEDERARLEEEEAEKQKARETGAEGRTE